jgi:hypothetical protein
MSFMTLEEIDRRMYELGRTLAETHDKKVIRELYELALEREKVDKKSGLDPVVKVLKEG